MDTPIDSTDGVTYQGPDRVNQMQQSEREKRRRSSKATQEKFEDELEKRRRRQAEKDELFLESESEYHDNESEEDQAPTEADSGEEDSEGNAVEKEDGVPEHIDVKA